MTLVQLISLILAILLLILLLLIQIDLPLLIISRRIRREKKHTQSTIHLKGENIHEHSKSC